jgi:hypothetical protein
MKPHGTSVTEELTSSTLAFEGKTPSVPEVVDYAESVVHLYPFKNDFTPCFSERNVFVF